METAPENIIWRDFIIIDCAPDDGCSQWLKELNGNFNCVVTVFCNGEDIQIGSPDAAKKLKSSTLNAYHINITAYADISYIRVEKSNLSLEGKGDAVK